MSKKVLRKVLVSAALGGATLLIAPGIALADDGQSGDWSKHDDKSSSHCSEWDKKDDKGGKEYGKDDSKEYGKEESKDYGKDDSKDYGKDDSKEYGKDDKKDDKKDCDKPKGWVDGGGAGSATDVKLASMGGTLLAAAGIGGVVLMRRRRIDGSPA